MTQSNDQSQPVPSNPDPTQTTLATTPPTWDITISSEVTEKIDDLTPAQTRAFHALSAGQSTLQAAQAAGVSRRTIFYWLDEDHPFGQALNQWKHSLADNTRTRLLILGESATVQIAQAIRQGDTRAALAIVKGMGLLAAPPVGHPISQSVADKKRAQARAAVTTNELRKMGLTPADLTDPHLLD